VVILKRVFIIFLHTMIRMMELYTVRYDINPQLQCNIFIIQYLAQWVYPLYIKSLNHTHNLVHLVVVLGHYTLCDKRWVNSQLTDCRLFGSERDYSIPYKSFQLHGIQHITNYSSTVSVTSNNTIKTKHEYKRSHSIQSALLFSN